MKLSKRNILGLLMCSAFFIISCTSEREKNYDRDLALLGNYVDSLLVLEKARASDLQQSLQDCYHNGLRSQTIIQSYNSMSQHVLNNLNHLKSQRTNKQELIMVRSAAINSIKKHMLDLTRHQVKYILPLDSQRFVEACDRSLNKPAYENLKLNILITKLDLLILQNKYTSLLRKSCSKLTIVCFFSPFSNSLEVKNYQRNKKSFLEIGFPDGLNLIFVRGLKKESQNDTITIPASNIQYIKTSRFENPSLVKLDLSFLEPGKYEISPGVYMVRPDNTVEKTPYTKSVDFEVFQ